MHQRTSQAMCPAGTPVGQGLTFICLVRGSVYGGVSPVWLWAAGCWLGHFENPRKYR